VLTEYPITTANSLPVGISVGPDNELWFAESDTNKIGRVAAGVLTTAPPPGAVLQRGSEFGQQRLLLGVSRQYRFRLLHVRSQLDLLSLRHGL
jgi:hypothetical protein